MAPKKSPIKESRNADENKPEAIFERTLYETNDAATSISLLESKEYNVVLRAIGTLSRYIENESILDYLFKSGIFSKLLELLTHTDVYILRFTFKILTELVSVKKYLDELNSADIFLCIHFVTKFYLENEDDLIKECSSIILLEFVKYNVVYCTYIYSKELVQRIFVILKSSKDADVQRNSLEIFFHIIASKEAEEQLLTIDGFSLEALLCLHKSEFQEIKDFAINILHRMSLWRSEELLIKYTKEKVAHAMLYLIMNDSPKYYDEAFDIVYACITHEQSAIDITNTLEFIQFSYWIRTGPHKAVICASPILALLTRIPQLRQTLFDFSVEDTILSLFRCDHEPIITSACEAVSNMTCHKYCCEKMMTATLIKTLLNILIKAHINPYGEIILQTILNFMKRNFKTMEIFVKCKGFTPIIQLFENSQELMTTEGYENILCIIQCCGVSKYSYEVSNVTVFHTLLNLFKNRFYVLKVLSIMNTFVPSNEFREFFFEYNMSDVFINALESISSVEIFKQVLFVIQNLLMYKNITLDFLDKGLLAFLRGLAKEIKEDVGIINDICNTLYNLCLSLKFFDIGRLEINDNLRDYFYLVHDKWFERRQSSGSLNSTNSTNSTNITTCRPIYVINFSEVKTLDIDLNISITKESSYLSRLDSSLIVNKCANQGNSFNSPVNAALRYIRSRHDFSWDYINSKVSGPSINYGCLSPDPYLAQYLQTLYGDLYYCEETDTALQKKVKHVAYFVEKQLSGFEETHDMKRKQHVFEVHLMNLKTKLGCSLIPIGYLRMGFFCERALLFKVLADNLKIPCTLCRGNGDIYWNEVPFMETNTSKSKQCTVVYFVVDLMEKVGRLMPAGSPEALAYCHLNRFSSSAAETYKHKL